MRFFKRTAACLTAVLFAAVLPLTASASPDGFQTNSCMVFATEPGATSEYVSFYKDGTEQSIESMTWVDGGVHGKALKLDGVSEYLSIGRYQTQLTAMTFAAWINFGGAVDATNPASAYWQRLLTIEAGEERYFTVSPHAVDNSITTDAGYALDGVYMEYSPGSGAEGSQQHMQAFSGVEEGMSHFGLPQNEWHHIAVVMDASSIQTNTVTLYIDGSVALQKPFSINPAQMSANSLMVGKGIWGNATLNALLDDVLLFDASLNQEQVRALMQTGDPAVVKTAEPVYSTTTGYEPTVPSTTMPTQDMQARSDDQPLTIFGLEAPLWGVALTVGLFGLFIVLSLTVSLYERYWRRKNGKEPKKAQKPQKPQKPKKQKLPKAPKKPKGEEDADDDEPTLSIKEAALQKRREEYERFLDEETNASDDADDR